MSKKIPFCKVCKDSGKSEAVFTSHTVKDSHGKTICPTLLKLNCKKCGKPGHTINYCASKNWQKPANEILIKESKPLKSKPLTNAFSVLDSSDDEEEEEETTKMEIMSKRFSKISESNLSPNVTLRPHQMSWAEKVAVPPLPLPLSQITADPESSFTQIKFRTTEKEKALSIGIKNGTIKWADVEDSSDDDGDDDDVGF